MLLADTLFWVLPQVFWDITKGSQHGLKTMNRHYDTLLFLFPSLSVTLTVQLGTALSLITDASAWHLGCFQTLLIWMISWWLAAPSSSPNQTLFLRQSRGQCFQSFLLSSIQGYKLCIHYFIDVRVISHEYEYIPQEFQFYATVLHFSLKFSCESVVNGNAMLETKFNQLITSLCSSDD